MPSDTSDRDIFTWYNSLLDNYSIKNCIKVNVAKLWIKFVIIISQMANNFYYRPGDWECTGIRTNAVTARSPGRVGWCRTPISRQMRSGKADHWIIRGVPILCRRTPPEHYRVTINLSQDNFCHSPEKHASRPEWSVCSSSMFSVNSTRASDSVWKVLNSVAMSTKTEWKV